MCGRFTFTEDITELEKLVLFSKLVNNAKHDSPDCLLPVKSQISQLVHFWR